jgi:phenylalanyl-tRNA synthetase beta subunit
LIAGLKDSYERNNRLKELLGLKQIRIFEIGTVWKDQKESLLVGTADEKGVREEVLVPHAHETDHELPMSQTLRYQPFSRYPYIVRDIALWVPKGTEPAEVLKVITDHAGELVVRSEKFDEFQKGERTSYAFRLVFQSMDRTLFDGDANARMESVYAAVRERGWEVR